MSGYAVVLHIRLEAGVLVHNIVDILSASIGQCSAVGALGPVTKTVLLGVNIYAGVGVLHRVGVFVVRLGVVILNAEALASNGAIASPLETDVAEDVVSIGTTRKT